MDNQAFLDAIMAAPEDDVPRLVFADWLEERGDPRAEFIRVQCALAHKAKYDPERLRLEKREREILAKHGTEWAAPLASITRDYEYHRGFIDTVSIGGRKFLTHGDKLFRLAPIRHVRITRLGTSSVTAAELAGCNLLRQIRGLVLRGMLSPKDVHTLLTAPHLKNLTTLSVEGYFQPGSFDPIFDGCLPNLEALDLGVDEGSVLTTAHIEKLVNANWASRLRHLGLKNHAINVGGVQAIAGSRRLKGLMSLDLHHSGVGLGGTQALADSPHLPNLTTLDLRRNRLTDSAARALAASTKLPALAELFLGMNVLGPEGARALANWPGLARLRSLHLFGNPIGDDGVCALAESAYVANLCRLDVTQTDSGKRGEQALAKSPYLKQARVEGFKE